MLPLISAPDPLLLRLVAGDPEEATVTEFVAAIVPVLEIAAASVTLIESARNVPPTDRLPSLSIVSAPAAVVVPPLLIDAPVRLVAPPEVMVASWVKVPPELVSVTSWSAAMLAEELFESAPEV